jgi:hypothetical protein
VPGGGLFVDLPRPRERCTLVGCAPDGALADLLDRLPAEALGAEQAWLGDLSLMAPPPPGGTPPSRWGEDLGDVVVLAQRPSITTPGTVGIDLDGFVHVYDRTDAVVRPGDDQAEDFRRRVGPTTVRAGLTRLRPTAVLIKGPA